MIGNLWEIYGESIYIESYSEASTHGDFTEIYGDIADNHRQYIGTQVTFVSDLHFVNALA